MEASKPAGRWDPGGEMLTCVMKLSRMLWFERDKEKHRFYLLPGMGGSARRRKHRQFLAWSIVTGLGVSVVLTFILYFMSRQK